MANKECPDCSGTGRCKHCRGTGKYPYGVSSASPCPYCDRRGNGVCRRCHGEGKVYY